MTTKTTPTTPTPADRLAAAKAAEGAARDALTALRERHMLGESPVTAEEFGAAGHAVELAELEREGAETAFAEAERRDRLAKLAEIRADIEASGGPAIDAEAEEQAAAALAAIIIRQAELQRKVRQWTDQLRALGVEETRAGGPDEEDAGLGFRDYGWGGTPPAVLVAGQPAITAGDPGGIVERVLAAAAAKAGVGPAMLEPFRR